MRVHDEIERAPLLFGDKVVEQIDADHPEIAVRVPFERNAQQLAHGAIGTVGANDPVCRERDILAADRMVDHHRRPARLIMLLDPDDLMREAGVDAGDFLELLDEHAVHAPLT